MQARDTSHNSHKLGPCRQICWMVHTYTYYTYVCMYVRIYMHTYIHTYIRTYIHTYIHTHMMHTCIRMYVRMYVHTCIHTYILYSGYTVRGLISAKHRFSCPAVISVIVICAKQSNIKSHDRIKIATCSDVWS